MNESFTYDNLNRLTDIELNGVQTGMMTYDDYGRMTSKTMDGQLVFQGASFDGPEGKPHAIKSVETNEGVFPADRQDITYTSFDKVKTIVEGDNSLSYTYGYDRQRIGMVETANGIRRSKTYVGNCEYVTETADGVTTEKVLTYHSGPTGVFAVVEKQGEEESLHYILKDHLGSWTTITDAEGNVEQELSFDAWGNLRDADTWTGTSTEAPMFDRGYTGHEHITAFGLINMNGRCYDPLMSSFLSVDEYVQDPTSAQNFNRYAYCLNNPLKYTDPSGWFYQGGSHSVASDENARRLVVNSELYAEQYERFFGQKENHKAYYMEGEEQKGGGGAGGGLKITGDMAKEAFEDLQRGTNMKLDYDPETGLVSYSGMKLKKNGKPYKMTAADEKLLAVIESDIVTVNLFASDISPFLPGCEEQDEVAFWGGSCQGANLSKDKSSAQSFQVVSPILLNILDNSTNTEGLGMMHEVTESYTIGLKAIEIGESIGPASSISSMSYNYYKSAHSNLNTTVAQPEYKMSPEFFAKAYRRRKGML